MMNNTVLHPQMPLDAGLLFRLQVGLLFVSARSAVLPGAARRQAAAEALPRRYGVRSAYTACAACTKPGRAAAPKKNSACRRCYQRQDPPWP
jgi:hypothetical protein